jgi:hypothetical protein
VGLGRLLGKHPLKWVEIVWKTWGWERQGEIKRKYIKLGIFGRKYF